MTTSRLLCIALASAAACQSASACLSRVSARAAVSYESDNPFYADTYLLNEGTDPVYVGVRAFREETLEFLSLVKCKRVTINDLGGIESFAPALPPAPGVLMAPPGVPLSYAVFDSSGRLLSWAMSSGPTLCYVYFDANLQAWACDTVECASPNVCWIDYVQDPETGQITVTCPCSVAP